MNNDHIPTEEIHKDIADTEEEIRRMREEIGALRILGDRMSVFRADHKAHGIEERKQFIEKLKKILADRAAEGK